MNRLPAAAIVLGAVMVALHAPCLLVTARVRPWLERFPRHRALGIALAAVDLLWAARLLDQMPLGRFESWKPSLYVLTPLVFFLVIYVMKELLAARALGGLLLLVPAPLLRAAQWHPSPLKLLVVLLAYVFAVVGMTLVLSPYHFRKAAARLTRDAGATRICGFCGVTAGAIFVLLGLALF